MTTLTEKSSQLAPTDGPPPALVTIIEPSRGWLSLQLDRVWAYRELLYFLVWRDIKVRYKQAALGVMWIILQPQEHETYLARCDLLRLDSETSEFGLNGCI